jgi:predicted transcriptional regulator
MLAEVMRAGAVAAAEQPPSSFDRMYMMSMRAMIRASSASTARAMFLKASAIDCVPVHDAGDVVRELVDKGVADVIADGVELHVQLVELERELRRVLR